MFSKALYGKKASKEELKNEIRDSLNIGSIVLGEKHIIRKVFLSVSYASFEDVNRVYMRVESGEYGDIQLDQYSVVLIFSDNSEGVLECDNQKVAQKVLDWIGENHSEIQIGKI